MMIGEKYIYHLIPDLDYSLGISLELLSYYLAIPILFEFINSLYSLDINQNLRKIILVFSLVSSLCILFFPPAYFTKTLFAFHIYTILSILYVHYILISAIFKKREGQRF
jgi:hypothetical protein